LTVYPNFIRTATKFRGPLIRIESFSKRANNFNVNSKVLRRGQLFIFGIISVGFEV